MRRRNHSPALHWIVGCKAATESSTLRKAAAGDGSKAAHSRSDSGMYLGGLEGDDSDSSQLASENNVFYESEITLEYDPFLPDS